MQIIIISQNQAKWLPEMSESLAVSFPGMRHVFVLDRCTDDSKGILVRLNEIYIENHKGEGFLAGRMRDKGVDFLGIDDTLFLDGDRVPVGLNDKICSDGLRMFNILLLRIANGDSRPFKHSFAKNNMWGKLHNNVFTCGILIDAKTIAGVRQFQAGRLFHPFFDGGFGEEDRFFGDAAHHLGFTCGLFPLSCSLKGNVFHDFDRDAYVNRVNMRLKLQQEILCSIK